MQQQGYDKLSEDTQKTLDDTIKAIQGNADEQEKIVKLMLDRVKANYKTAYGEIDKAIDHTGTKVSESTTTTIDQSKEKYASLIESIKTNITGAFTALPSEVTKKIETSPINIKVTFNGKTIDEIEAELRRLTGQEVDDQKPATTTNSGGTSGGSSGGSSGGNKGGTSGNTKKDEHYYDDAIISGYTGDNKVSDVNYKEYALNALNVAKSNAEAKGDKKEVQKITAELTERNSRRNLIDNIIKEYKKSHPHSGKLSDAEKKYNKLYKFVAQNFKITPDTALYLRFADAMGAKVKTETKDGKKKVVAEDRDMLYKMLRNNYGYAKGTLGTKKDELNWTHQGEIIRRSDGAILRQLPAGTQVVPKIESANLMKWGTIDPNKFFADALRSMSATNSVNTNTVVNNYEALIKVEGDVNADVMDRLEAVAQYLLNKRELQQEMTNIVTKNLTREMGKLGYKR